LLALGSASLGAAAEVHVQGAWGLLIGPDSLPGGAGASLAPTYTSDRQAVAVSIISTGGRAWTLRIARSRPDWPAGLSLHCRRTGDGLGAVPPRGGLGFVPITDVPEILCAGVGDVVGIPLQFQIAGVTLSQGPGACDLSATLRVEEAP